MGAPPKKVLCAPDSFKETLSAVRAADAMAAGAADCGVVADPCPIADGGEGSLDVLTGALRATMHEAAVTGPLGDRVDARFAVAGSTAVIEMAQASGFGLATGDPTRTTTYGTGELIAAAVGLGCQTLIVCVGGSATVDGGAGLIQALGGRFIDRAGRLIAKPLTGATLGEVAACERPVNLPRIRVACDVTNPLFGPQGAARTYGPQMRMSTRP